MRRWAAKIRAGLEELRRSDQLLLVLSLVIGALVGLVVVAFILLTGRLAARMYPPGGSGWRRILVPVLGLAVHRLSAVALFPVRARQRHPANQVRAVRQRRPHLHSAPCWGKFFCCSASLASGIALGREGPSVQVGAGIASVVARNLGLNARQVKALVPVGCAAALAAAFNTPIAAVLFSLEEIMGDLHASVLGSVVLSSATSWMVLHLVLGDDPLFHVSGYQLVHPVEFGVYAVLGVVGGLGSVAFVKLLLRLRAWFATLAEVDGLVSAGGRRPDGRRDGLLRAGSDGRRLQLRRQGAERRRGAEAGGAVRGAEDRRHGGLLRLRQRGRHFRAGSVHRRDDGRGRGQRGAHAVSRTTPPVREPTRWWAWARPSPESCARR